MRTVPARKEVILLVAHLTRPQILKLSEIFHREELINSTSRRSTSSNKYFHHISVWVFFELLQSLHLNHLTSVQQFYAGCLQRQGKSAGKDMLSAISMRCEWLSKVLNSI